MDTGAAMIHFHQWWYVIAALLLLCFSTTFTTGELDLAKLKEEARINVLNRLRAQAERWEPGRIDDSQFVDPFSVIELLKEPEDAGNARNNSAVRSLTLPAAKHLEAMRLLKMWKGLGRSDMERLFFCEQDPEILEPVNPETLSQPMIDQCPYHNDAICDPEARYRTFDGTCNNLEEKFWGAALRPFSRFMAPDYSDGVASMRVAQDGRPLTSTREVSLTLYEDMDIPSRIHTLMHTAVGQFLAHDVTKSVGQRRVLTDGTRVRIRCGSDGCDDEEDGCLPITIDEVNDPDFAGQKCLRFVRSAAVLAEDCTGPRQQLNEVTSFLDASAVYGSSAEEADGLREPGSALLRSSEHPFAEGVKEMLPTRDSGVCSGNDDVIKCFTGGDTRVDVFVGLAALHTVFLREHNRLVRELTQRNPLWEPERLYQEARRIVTAVVQILIYKEYLPVVLGVKIMEAYGLNLLKTGYFEGYDAEVNPSLSNVVATAALRFGHSQVPDVITMASQDYSKVESTEFSNVFVRPGLAYRTDAPGGLGIDSLNLGMIFQSADKTDRFFTKELTARLFSNNPPNGTGTDLPALNTQRGRDHGLPGYNDWQEWCGRSRLSHFDDLADLIPEQEVRDKFEKLYDNVDDIDLYPAGLAEKPLPGSLVGPTFGCIMALQFRFLRVGDRYWHETNDSIIRFTKDQLQELRKVTLARLLCDNLDRVEDVQKLVFIQPLDDAIKNMVTMDEVLDIMGLYHGNANGRRPCSEIPRMDLGPWEEKDSGN